MSNSDQLSLIKTGDGSNSLYCAKFQDTYHSQHGAIQESKHVFIQAGLQALSQRQFKIDILEIGFGTGLNLVMTLEFLKTQPHIQAYYESWEAYPPPKDIIRQLNYSIATSQEDFQRLHELAWNTEHKILSNLTFQKQLASFEDIDMVESFDLIFFDAFAPTKQPDLWKEPFLSKIARATRSGGILVTYCSQGAFRRTLEDIGFSVEKLAGPPGKREMVRATKF
ncbi:MAG: tRNA (5-methylaminomethyl-2-thiouridine)(34)-methyltransferase MnmD [Saprospiraceae bacterium]|nr:tRNA (5-methylaminomethyl-2-thiouridine)(34)-methyltransferase MnmD [Saprospiraceae bacterium]